MWDIDREGSPLSRNAKRIIFEAISVVLEDAGIDTRDVEELYITGSIAGLNWLPESDIDVHVLLRDQLPCGIVGVA